MTPVPRSGQIKNNFQDGRPLDGELAPTPNYPQISRSEFLNAIYEPLIFKRSINDLELDMCFRFSWNVE